MCGCMIREFKQKTKTQKPLSNGEKQMHAAQETKLHQETDDARLRNMEREPIGWPRMRTLQHVGALPALPVARDLLHRRPTPTPHAKHPSLHAPVAVAAAAGVAFEALDADDKSDLQPESKSRCRSPKRFTNTHDSARVGRRHRQHGRHGVPRRDHQRLREQAKSKGDDPLAISEQHFWEESAAVKNDASQRRMDQLPPDSSDAPSPPGASR